MKGSRRRVRDFLTGIFFAAGLYRFVRFLNKRKITILMLHGVEDDESPSSWRPLWGRISKSQFWNNLTRLQDYYTFIPLDAAVDMLTGARPIIDHAAVLTFDDGYANNFNVAAPILRRLGVPATFFVTTGYIETQRSFWIDRLDFAIQHAPEHERLVNNGGYYCDLRGLSFAELQVAYHHLRREIKSAERSDANMLALFEEISLGLEKKAALTIADVLEKDKFVSITNWDALRWLDPELTCIGSHTVDHARLSCIPRDEAHWQIKVAKESIERELDSECLYFCYPDGNLNQEIKQLVKEAGHRAAVSTERGLNAIGIDLFHLRRFSFPESEIDRRKLLELCGLTTMKLFQVVRRYFR